MRAVVFDLFGTLVYDRFSSRHRGDLIRTLAEGLGAAPDQFDAAWKGGFHARSTGVYATIADNLADVAQQNGWDRDPVTLARLQGYFHDFTLESMAPVPGALDLLDRLRAQGIRTGLISDCSPAVPAVWSRTAWSLRLDATVFSCRAGAAKPTPLLYRLCLDQLELEPGDCLYLGDGGGDEIAGAASLGFRAILVQSHLDPDEQTRWQAPNWTGERIDQLTDLIGVL